MKLNVISKKVEVLTILNKLINRQKKKLRQMKIILKESIFLFQKYRPNIKR